MDYLDIITGRFMQTFVGRYYPRLPRAELVSTQEAAYNSVAAEYFDYEFIDPESYSYRQLLQNVVDKDGADTTVKSRTALAFRVGGYVLLANGNAYSVTSVSVDTRAASREAARLLPIPAGTEYVLRLTRVENPRGL